MKKVLVLCLGLVTFGAWSQEAVVVPSISGMLEQTQGNIVALAEAFSEDQMNWRPAEGVRSVGETILHTAAANYYIAMKMGYTLPEGVDIMTMESIQGKEAIIDTFKQSSAFIKEKMAMVEAGTFGDEVDLGFAKPNRLSSLLIILEHNGEHKGQLIAYARSNGVVPPWSQGGQ
ncbi:DinB family protein [Robiginitalea sediminis]|uniref:DinB family protein n=1 Tax=Robiginitalea sediminis TaxID=1982593 RepID=UPI000B4A586A|nr:DinB family protein [Robiginitalea sediminis]